MEQREKRPSLLGLSRVVTEEDKVKPHLETRERSDRVGDLSFGPTDRREVRWGYKADDDIKKRRHTTKDSGKTMDWCYKWTCVASPKLVIEARCLPHLAFSRRLRLLPHFRWGWLCLPPSRLGHWASSWLSAWRRFLTVASLRDFFLGLILSHGVF